MACAGTCVLERERDYEGSVDLLRRLLGQRVYCVYSRGRWWDRYGAMFYPVKQEPRRIIVSYAQAGVKPGTPPQAPRGGRHGVH